MINPEIKRNKVSAIQFASWSLLAFLLMHGFQPAWSQEASSEYTRPWESRPYQVQVWICNEATPQLTAVIPQVSIDLMRRAEITDASAWKVQVQTAPAIWKNRLLNSIQSTDELLDLTTVEEINKYDKLIVIGLTQAEGFIRYQVREYDIQTGQWGALIARSCPQPKGLSFQLFAAIERVFMPLAKIDRVSSEGEVFVRARAINACQEGDITDGGVTAIENSPVWIRPQDRFLPIIRKVDRNGDLTELEPIPFTYLTIDSPQKGSRLVCELHSRQRSVLGGRSSKRAQKLALVIRPPETPTSLNLVSRSDKSKALSGYEIYSRKPGASKDEPSEFLGLTDWRGSIEVPPTEDGLRLIYVKRGTR
ncbi:MAG: hypothetical protein AAGA30_04465, partial [Planctomycetota bacterium]